MLSFHMNTISPILQNEKGKLTKACDREEFISFAGFSFKHNENNSNPPSFRKKILIEKIT